MIKDRTLREITSNARAILNPNKWLEKAEDLIFSAENLEPSVHEFWNENSSRDTHNVYLMLLGYAIENLLKAVLVSKLTPEEKEKVMRKGVLPQNLKRHCGIELVKNLGIKFSHETESLSDQYGKFPSGTKNLIERIGNAVIWRGRYPSQNYPQGKLFSPDGQFTSYHLYTDVEFAMGITKKIKEFVYKKIRAISVDS